MAHRKLIATFCLMLFSGCEQTRSFLQMDSNSGSPFMGLQFSVDARNPKSDVQGRTPSPTATMVSAGSRSKASIVTMQASLSQDQTELDDFVTTAESRPVSGNLKFSLPTINLADNPVDAAEVDEIMTRI